MQIGTLLLKRRKERRLSQSEAAEQIGVSQSTYCAWESDRVLPSARHYGPLAGLLGLDVRELLFLAAELPAPAALPLAPPANPPVPTLQDDLVSVQRETIALQKQRIEHLEAENQQLQQRLTGVTKLAEGAALLITLLLNFSGLLLVL